MEKNYSPLDESHSTLYFRINSKIILVFRAPRTVSDALACDLSRVRT